MTGKAKQFSEAGPARVRAPRAAEKDNVADQSGPGRDVGEQATRKLSDPDDAHNTSLTEVSRR